DFFNGSPRPLLANLGVVVFFRPARGLHGEGRCFRVELGCVVAGDASALITSLRVDALTRKPSLLGAVVDYLSHLCAVTASGRPLRNTFRADASGEIGRASCRERV